MDRRLLVLLGLPVLFSCSQEESVPSIPEVKESGVTALEVTEPIQPPAAERPAREITNIVGDLYLARNKFHNTVFLVTPEGTILSDPISVDFAEWIKVELAERFDSTVRYVLYSHHHWDHASGGAVFEDTAEFVGHENMLEALASPLPSNQIQADLDGDGAIGRSEAKGALRATFNEFDLNGDDKLTGAEINVDIRAPDITYADSYLVTLGGEEVQLAHGGHTHSIDGSIMVFPKERVGFAVDHVNVTRFPGGLRDSSTDQWVDSVNQMIDLDIDIMVPGHGRVGTHADIVAYAQFFRDLGAAVEAAVAAGLSAEEAQESIKLEAYQDWERYYSHRPMIVADAYEFAIAAEGDVAGLQEND